MDPEVADVIASTAAVLERAGARVEHACPDLDGSDAVFRTLRAAEFDANWRDLLAAHPDGFVDFLADNIRQGAALSGRDVMTAYAELTRLRQSAARFFDDYDLVLAPVTQIAAFPVEWPWPRSVSGTPMHDYLEWMRSAWLFTPLGIPALSLPAGFTPAGLPVGAHLLAGPGRDLDTPANRVRDGIRTRPTQGQPTRRRADGMTTPLPQQTEAVGRVATPGRVAATWVPIVLMTITPLLPFATTPTTWFGVPAVLVWVAALVVLTVATLQVVDRRINRQTAPGARGGSIPMTTTIIVVGIIVIAVIGFSGRRRRDLSGWTVSERDLPRWTSWFLQAGESLTTFSFLGLAGIAFTGGVSATFAVCYLTASAVGMYFGGAPPT